MNTKNYRRIVPNIRNLISFCRKEDIPIFYTEAVREPNGIDLLLNVHRILPRTREERLKVPICVRGTWDGQTIDEIRPSSKDHITNK
jgi:ureidoacrylate peracid hydrolase